MEKTHFPNVTLPSIVRNLCRELRNSAQAAQVIRFYGYDHVFLYPFHYATEMEKRIGITEQHVLQSLQDIIIHFVFILHWLHSTNLFTHLSPSFVKTLWSFFELSSVKTRKELQRIERTSQTQTALSSIVSYQNSTRWTKWIYSNALRFVNVNRSQLCSWNKTLIRTSLWSQLLHFLPCFRLARQWIKGKCSAERTQSSFADYLPSASWVKSCALSLFPTARCFGVCPLSYRLLLHTTYLF